METSEQIRLESMENLKRLRPVDDIFFREMLRDSRELARFMLRIITGIPDLEITEDHTQYDLHRLSGARSLRLDYLGKDSANRIYNLEMERSQERAEPRRARYHLSAMDVEFLKAGENFSALPITYVIFVTETDIFGDGKLIYPIERINTATGKPFNDDEHIIYLNSAYNNENDGSDLAKLAHDLLCSDPDKMYHKPLSDRARYLKADSRGVKHMCKIMEDTVSKIMEDRIDRAVHDNKIEMAVNCIKEGMGSIEMFAKITGLSYDEIKAAVERETARLQLSE